MTAPASGSGSFEQRARAMFRAIDERRFDALADYYTTDCRYTRPGFPPVEGIAGLEHFYREVRIIDRGCHALETIIVDGGRAVIAGSFTGVLKDGTETSIRFCDLYLLGDGLRISERRTFFDAPLV